VVRATIGLRRLTAADTLRYSGAASEYTATLNPDGSFTLTDTVPGRDGSDTIFGTPTLVFSDVSLAVELGTAGADTLTGTADTLFVAGGGVDTVDFSAESGRVDVDLSTGAAARPPERRALPRLSMSPARRGRCPDRRWGRQHADWQCRG
jgi:hypothetical protein